MRKNLKAVIRWFVSFFLPLFGFLCFTGIRFLFHFYFLFQSAATFHWILTLIHMGQFELKDGQKMWNIHKTSEEKIIFLQINTIRFDLVGQTPFFNFTGLQIATKSMAMITLKWTVKWQIKPNPLWIYWYISLDDTNLNAYLKAKHLNVSMGNAISI